MLEEALKTTIETFLVEVLQIIIIAVIPMVALQVTRWIHNQTNLVRSKMSYEQILVLDMLVTNAIKAAEQAGLTNAIEDTAESKKQFAINSIQKMLKARGFTQLADNVDELSVMIEASIRDGIHKGALSMPTDSMVEVK